MNIWSYKKVYGQTQEKILLSKKANEEWTQKHQLRRVRGGQWSLEAETRQPEMDGVSNDRCSQCGKEGHEHHRLYEREAHENTWDWRWFEISASTTTNSHQRKTFGLRKRSCGKTNRESNRLSMGRHCTHSRQLGTSEHARWRSKVQKKMGIFGNASKVCGHWLRNIATSLPARRRTQLWRVRYRVSKVRMSRIRLDLDRLDHAENMRHLEVMKDPPLKDGFEETQKLAQCWKSRVGMELKSTLIP